MLELLKTYAEKTGLVSEPGFKAKAARFAIEFDANGNFLSVAPLAEMPFPRCPELTHGELMFLKGAAQPLLSEVSNIALLTAKEDEEPDDKLLAKHAFFLARLQEAAAMDASFAPAAKGLSDPEILAKIRIALRNVKAKPTDKATFLIDSAFPLKGEAWQDWWREWRGDLLRRIGGNKKGGSEGGAAQMLCFVNGTPVTPLATHPKITGLGDVGGQAQVPFVGFDKEAFQSYGLTQSANAAVGEDAAYAYRAALDALLKEAEKFAEMKIVHWYKDEVAEDDDPFAYLLKQLPQETTEGDALTRFRSWLRSLSKGETAAEIGDNRYYVIALSGAGGRVMVRDWLTGTYASLVEATLLWNDLFTIVDLTGAKTVTTRRVEHVVTCPLRPKGTSQKREDWVKPVGSLRIPLWRAALKAAPIPEAAVRAALDAHRAAVVTGKSEDLPFTLYARMGLFKAYLVRNQGEKMEPTLDPGYTGKDAEAYHCGRLMAMLAAVQKTALPEVDAGVVQRYYGAASATPALVLGRLIKLSQHHLAKIRGDRPGLAYWYETRIGEIVSALGSSAPKRLTLTQQTLFALGYYQQIAFNRTKKAQEEAGGTIDPPEVPAAENVTENNGESANS